MSLNKTSAESCTVQRIEQPDLKGILYEPKDVVSRKEYYPALVIIPDDSGISEKREIAYATYFASQGFTCFIVDPFSFSGIRESITNPSLLSSRNVISMAFKAYALLIVRRGVSAVGALGMGRGGMVALQLAMDSLPHVGSFMGRFDFVVSVSPAAYIQLRNLCPNGCNILILNAEFEEVYPVESVLQYARRIQAAAPQITVDVRTVPEMFHAWENSGTPRYDDKFITFSKEICYLEDNGTYSNIDKSQVWLPKELKSYFYTRVGCGARIGGGDRDSFYRVCSDILNFIRSSISSQSISGVGLQLLTRMDMRDSLMLKMARCTDVWELFNLVTETLASTPDAALVRIWRVAAPKGRCRSCIHSAKCLVKDRCLQLVASDGYSINENAEWKGVNGKFANIPMDMYKTGMVASTGAPFFVDNVTPDLPWVGNPSWIVQEKIQTVIGQPLIHNYKVLGVFFVFSRTKQGRHVMDGLRIIADHLAIRIAHAEAFSELDQLKRRLEIENTYLQAESANNVSQGMLGTSRAIQEVRRQIQHVAKTDAAVLIIGESGTGKELVANEIHANSRVADGPLVKVNCPSVPRELFESEFFGHVKGSFTGATRNQIGFFEAASDGTIFLDEIGEIELFHQTKLLRALQEKEYRKVGEKITRKFTARLVAATNRDLLAMVRQGTFREDLYYRLNIFPLHIPPLRERKEDIPHLVDAFLSNYSTRYNKGKLALADGQLEILMAYDWPGNIRELLNVINRAAILSNDGLVYVDFIENQTDASSSAPRQSDAAADAEPRQRKRGAAGQDAILNESEMRELEKQNILRALKACNRIVFGARGAAELLGIKPTTLLARMKKMGIDKLYSQ